MHLCAPTLKRLAAVLAAALCASGFIAAARAAAAPSREGVEFFEKQIRPLLAERCYECHGADSKKRKGGLRLDSREGVLAGGHSGPALVPGKPDSSLLIKAVRYSDDDLQMPPKHKLPDEAIAALEQWVNMGAPDPREGGAAANYGIDIAEARQFWSLRPVEDPPPPTVRNKRWAHNGIDRFILAKLEARNMAPAPDATKRTLLRRATFDLTGLPPTPEEMDAFLNDHSPNPFEKVVDRLLASPHYGERWGRHWLDVVRYADTSGCNSDFPVATAFRYRNYVIDSFNRDKPYDRFLREQIAGDLLPSSSDEERFEQIIATGYLAISRRFGSRANEFHLTIEDTLDNLGKSVLGLSLACARCHDHKFDPVPMRDYYALYGIFNSTRYAFPGTEIYRHAKDFIPLTSSERAEEVLKYQSDLAALDNEIEKLKEQRRALERANAGSGGADESDGSREKLATITAALDAAQSKQKELADNPPDVEKAYAVADGKTEDAKLHLRGDPRKPGETVPRGFLQVLGSKSLPSDESGSGRRQLAEWLTGADNPLTARVMVNRIWQHHFGRGIVRSSTDFGTRGDAPTHPELLDYLASRFVESGWSIKAMHKLIMLSHAYQMSSAEYAKHALADPNNDSFWRFNRRRLDAEEIRDAMLAVSGALDRTMGGAHPFPPENTWRYTQHKPFVAVYETDKRSIYLMQQRIKKHPFLEMFDGADTNATTGNRPVSTTPLQALFMMNDPFAHQQADRFAARIAAEFGDEAKQIDYACRLAFGRPATREEIQTGRAYLAECRDALSETDVPTDAQPRAALASFCRVLLSSNEFVFLD